MCKGMKIAMNAAVFPAMTETNDPMARITVHFQGIAGTRHVARHRVNIIGSRLAGTIC